MFNNDFEFEFMFSNFQFEFVFSNSIYFGSIIDDCDGLRFGI